MRIHISRYALLVALLVMLWATETMAATIGFDGLTGPNLSSFPDRYVGGYVEDGFNVKATGGQWFEARIFGNGVPAIGAGPIYNSDPGASQTITVTGVGSGLFTFGGVDLTSNSAGGTIYEIAGFLDASGGGSQVFTTTFQIDSINHFESKLSGIVDSESKLFSELGSVNRLTITGKRGVGVTSFNIDNIRLTAANGPGPPGPGCTALPCPDPNVPEPTSIMLLGAGLAGIEIWRRRRGEG